MELKNYPAPYVLFGSLLAMGNRLQAAGDRFYDEITTKQWLCWRCWRPFQLRQHWASWRAVWEVRIKT